MSTLPTIDEIRSAWLSLGQLAMDGILLVEQADLCTLSFGLLVLAAVSHRVVYHRTELVQWGLRLGLLVLIAWMLRRIALDGFHDVSVLTVSFIRGLAMAGAVTCTCWLVFPVLDYLVEILWRKPIGAIKRWFSDLRGTHAARRATMKRRLEEQRSRLDAEERSPEEQRQRQDLVQRQREKNEQQRQREQVRFETQLLYDQNRTALEQSFPEEKFNAYFSTFLTDELDPETFAARAAQLSRMITERVQHDSPAQQFESLDELIAYFDQKAALLESAGLDKDTTETLQIAFAHAKDQAIEEFLK